MTEGDWSYIPLTDKHMECVPDVWDFPRVHNESEELGRRTAHWLHFQRAWVRFPAPTWWRTTVYNTSSKGELDGSVVKSTDCTSRGLGFDSQHPHGSSPLSTTLVLRDLMSSSGFHGHCMHRLRYRRKHQYTQNKNK